jgi:hypothetical protein
VCWPASQLHTPSNQLSGLQPHAALTQTTHACCTHTTHNARQAKEALKHPYFDDLDKETVDKLENPDLEGFDDE